MRKCRHCKAELPKVKDCTEIVQAKGFCSFDHMARHGLAKARAQKAKQARAALRQRKEAIKTRSEHMRECQAAFNTWVRARDGGLPCISCGRHHQGQYHAGHFRAVGSCPALRFEPLNVWRQCAPCNTHLSGNLIMFRKALVERVGQEAVDWLEGPHEPKKYTIDELKEIKARYRRMTRELQKQAA
jgi:hypothetical protein